MNKIITKLPLGEIEGFIEDGVEKYFGLRYAKAKRFEYSKRVEKWEGVQDCTKFGDGCPQTRAYVNQLNNPERRFYHREFREGMTFSYSDDCLNLNVWKPENANNSPVMVFIHGGGFNSGTNNEKYLDGSYYAKKGIVFISIGYRVSILGNVTGESIRGDFGQEGNFGLFDQVEALKFIKDYVDCFGGNKENITLMGQSAGAMSIQYLCMSKLTKGLFNRVIMLSGGGLMPKMVQPKPAIQSRDFWKAFCERCGVKDILELQDYDLNKLYTNFEEFKGNYIGIDTNNMPVVDGVLIEKPLYELEKMKQRLDVTYLISTTKHDMFPLIFYNMAGKWIRGQKVDGYVALFDRDLPGDNCKSFHSCDQWYALGSMEKGWRPFEKEDYELKDKIMSYYTNFAYTGDPNGEGLSAWTKYNRKNTKRMIFQKNRCHMGHANILELLFITLKFEKYEA